MRNIEFPKVQSISVAITHETNEQNQSEWNVFLLNTSENAIKNILISSEGYGEIDGEQRRTSIIRRFIEEMDANTFVKIEPINPDLFQLFNEYWISYYIDNTIYDKKFIFVPNSINTENLTKIEFIGLDGVLHI
jgi:hypothetical protein